MDGVSGQYKDPLHNLPPTSDNSHYITNGIDETAHDHIVVVDVHPQLRFCSTSCVCMIIGVTIAFGSIAMTACSYFADVLARDTFTHGNVTEIIVDDPLRLKLIKFKTIGPILIGLGIFFMLCACVLLCEARDRLRNAETETEKILPIDYNAEDTYTTAASIKAETLAINPGMNFPSRSSSSSQDSESSTSSVNDEPHEHNTRQVFESPYESNQGSPVVVIHGSATSDDNYDKPSQPLRTDSLKRSKETDDNIFTDDDDIESSPKRPHSPLRKLPKLQFPPQSTSPNKAPRLLELSPSKLPGNHVNNAVFPKPVPVIPVKLPPVQHNGNGLVVVGATCTSNQLLQTDFPSPSSSCDPSPVRAPRPHHRSKSSLLETHPTNIFLLQNMSSSDGDNLSSTNTNSSNNNLISRTVYQSDKHPDTPNCDEEASRFSPETEHYDSPMKDNHHQNDVTDMEISSPYKVYMETCINAPPVDNINLIENRPLAVADVSHATPTHHHQTENAAASLPESEHDSSQRDTNSNITGSTASVHSHNSNQSPNRTVKNNNKREIVLV